MAVPVVMGRSAGSLSEGGVQEPVFDVAGPPPITTARVVGGGLWSLGWQSATLLASLVATPFVIRLLGPTEYGVLALVNVLIGYAAVSELGMSQASTKFGAEAYSRGDGAGEAGVMWTALAVLLVPTTLCAGALFVASVWLTDRVLDVPPDARSAAVWALRLAAIAFALRAIAGVLSTPHLVRLRLGLFSGITNVGAVVQVATIPLLLWWLDAGLAAAVSVMAGVSIAVAATHGVVAWRFVPELIRPRVNRALVRPLFRYGSATALMVLVALVSMHAEKFLVAGLVSPAALAHYAVAFTLARLLVLLPGAMAQALLPAFAQLQIAPDRRPLQLLYTRSLRGLVVVNVPIAVLLAFSAGPLLTVWAGEDYGAAGLVPLVILTGACFVDGLSFVPRMLLQAIGRPDLMAKYLMMTVVPYLFGAVMFVRWWGIVGAAAAWALRTAVECVLMMIGARRAGGVSFDVGSLMPPGYALALVALVIPAGAGHWIGHSLAISTAVAAVSLVAYASITWTRVLTQEERDWAVGYGSRVLRLAGA